MTPALSVVKVGGSLVSNRARLRGVLAELADGWEGPAVVVPGGGPFAEAVRIAQDAVSFDDALAHRLALAAMGWMAEVFSELEPRLPIVRTIDEIGTGLADGRTAIWDPISLRAGDAEIPERWDVTSDSLALWLAARLGAVRCVLLKSAPCPVGAEPEALVRCGLVDLAFPAFARRFTGEIVLRGPDGEAAVTRVGRSNLASHPLPHPEVGGEAASRQFGMRGGVGTAEGVVERKTSRHE